LEGKEGHFKDVPQVIPDAMKERLVAIKKINTRKIKKILNKI